ncbi:MAG TPA: response regulator transcription factor [Acidimicrobiales bacterium]
MGARILVVDDDAFLRQLVTGLLQKDGHVVVQAASASEGLAALAEEPSPDLVLLDVELPDLSGLQLLDRVRARLPCPVVLMSGNGADSDRAAALARGAADYLVKPFPPMELTSRVAAVLQAAG